ncbi:MAG: anti-sigma factor [Acidobacteria bacterium]|nr:anti-sigma factor [Acidobacteriota bacterium]MBV9147343.1 anti-sigma factor [Acidobacteriota bacterium]MBV9436501.1 anti-sigma factor [Acidobacteriota bacterium]
MRDHQQISDDLVLYALRELPQEQAAELREHLEDCPQCRRELDAINSNMALLALSTVGSHAPQRSRERLLAAVRKEPRRARGFVMRRPWWSFVPSFAAVLLAAFGLMLWRENVTLRHRLEASQQDSSQKQADLERSKMVVDALTSPESSHFSLVSTKAQPVPEGRASYMKKTGTLVFTAQHLQPLPPQKTYQMWLIPASGAAPMPCGTFKPDANGMASLVMSNMEKDITPKMFAVTIESDGGSETPTMPIIMAGA